MSMSFPELLKVAKQLKHAGVITTLRLFVSLSEQHIGNLSSQNFTHVFCEIPVSIAASLLEP
jgi:hypothetical protein